MNAETRGELSKQSQHFQEINILFDGSMLPKLVAHVGCSNR